jgi:hypothetical protein
MFRTQAENGINNGADRRSECRGTVVPLAYGRKLLL